MKIYKQKKVNKNTLEKVYLSNSTSKLSHLSTKAPKKNHLSENSSDNPIKYLNTNKIIFQMIRYCILFIAIVPILSSNNSTRHLSTTSTIIIKIEETGFQEILSINYTGGYPNRVYLNDRRVYPTDNRKLIMTSDNNIIKMEWDSPLGNISYMFYRLTNIKEVDLSNVYSAEIWNMSNMFSGCSNITSINLNNFETHKVINMVSLFSQCYSLKSIDVSHFDTSKVEYMHYLFKGCYLFKSINVLNFDTSNVKDMSSMFADCRTITSLDISNFNTAKVVTMGHMFNGCYNLISLELSNFNTPALNYYDNMFKNCYNLAYINLVNAKEIDIKNIANILMNTMDNMVFCVKQSNIPKLRDEIDKKKCKVYDCEHDWRTVQKKIDPETGNCIQSCADTTNYKYEYLSQCYERCPEGTSANENNICETKQIIPTTIITQKIIETTNEEKILTTIPKIIQTTIPKIIETTIPKIIQTTIPKMKLLFQK